MKTTKALLQQAAEAGPGWRGKRTALDESQRQNLIDALTKFKVEAPKFLTDPCEWVDREAKLFEAGEYPDKGVTVTEADLDKMAANFDLPVPVLIEHSTSPLDLGYLTDIWASGSELFGRVALTAEADQIIRKSGASKLSVGLSPDLDEIREVSLVQRPRVASAQLFSFESEFDEDKTFSDQCNAEISRLIGAGKIYPHQSDMVRALLSCGQGVSFNRSHQSVGRIVLDLLKSGPSHSMFTEVGATGAPAQSGFDPDESAFYSRHFPDLSLEEIAKRIHSRKS